MKIIICLIIILLLLYYSFNFREKFVVTPLNINNGGIVNIGDQGEWDYENYSVADYNDDYGDEFKTEILFYKFEKDSTFEIEERYNSITLGFYLLYPEYSTSTTTVSQKDSFELLTTEVDKLAKFKLIHIGESITAELMISNGWKKPGSKIRIKHSDYHYVENYDYNGTNYQYTYDTTNLHPNYDPETKNEYTNESHTIKLIKQGSELIFPYYGGDEAEAKGGYNSIEKVELSTTEIENYCITEIPDNQTVNGRDERCGGLTNCEFKDDTCQQSIPTEVKTTTAGRETNIIDNVLTIQNGDDTYYLKTQIQDNKEYTVTMTNKNNNINLSLPNLVLNKLENLAWFLITINKDEIKLSYQNNPYLSKSYLHEQEIRISNIKFEKITADNYRYLGRIMIWPISDVNLKDICKHYYCGKYKCRFDLKYLKNKKTNIWNSLGNIDADLCIKECAERPEYRCDIEECQKMCIDCETPNDELTKIEKINICPWYTNIKLDIKPPEAPFIRGFPGLIDNIEPNNGSIIIEWKKPFNNMSKITHYILEVKEALTKYNSHKVITIEHDNCDICEYSLRNLKNQTTYEIELSAVNSKGISYKSNKLSITTNGDNNDFLQNIYKDISGDNDAFREYKCVRNFDNSDHILDQVMDEDINIYDYVKSM